MLGWISEMLSNGQRHEFLMHSSRSFVKRWIINDSNPASWDGAKQYLTADKTFLPLFCIISFSSGSSKLRIHLQSLENICPRHDEGRPNSRMLDNFQASQVERMFDSCLALDKSPIDSSKESNKRSHLKNLAN